MFQCLLVFFALFVSQPKDCHILHRTYFSSTLPLGAALTSWPKGRREAERGKLGLTLKTCIICKISPGTEMEVQKQNGKNITYLSGTLIKGLIYAKWFYPLSRTNDFFGNKGDKWALKLKPSIIKNVIKRVVRDLLTHSHFIVLQTQTLKEKLDSPIDVTGSNCQAADVFPSLWLVLKSWQAEINIYRGSVGCRYAQLHGLVGGCVDPKVSVDQSVHLPPKSSIHIMRKSLCCAIRLCTHATRNANK